MSKILPSSFWFLVMAIVFSSATGRAQSWGASSAKVRAQVPLERGQLDAGSWTSGLELRNIGPSVMGGRVVDVAVVADTMYVAYATGGLWKSINHGTSFTPLLNETCLLGAVAAHPSGRIVVGSGEVNSSRSSYAGDGIYISDDHGETWRHAGLEGSHHIGRVIIDADNPDRIWVAALGELYSENQGGAIYRSDNGGKDWNAVLSLPSTNQNEVVGFVDLVVDDNNPAHLFAASWDRTRRAHDFVEGGEGTGIWETKDGGDHWERISRMGGFPEGKEAGRIGLAYHSNSGTLYALIDNQETRPEDQEEKDSPEEPAFEADIFLGMTAEEFAKLDNAKLQDFLTNEGFAEADSAASVKARIASGELQPRALYDYLTDGNRALFDSEIVGPELYRYQIQMPGENAVPNATNTLNALANPSSRRHESSGVWERTHEGFLDDVCYTYGYYFGTISVDPSDESTVYIAGVPLLKSTDGGATFSSVGAPNVHVDHHKLWIDPSNPNHLINGNDGGINISWDGGAHWVKCNTPSVGQFYAVEVDEADSYRVFGGLQDNGTWAGLHTHQESPRWKQSGHHGFESLSGGDGMQIEVDTRTNDIVYTGYQFGWYARLDETTGERTSLHPSHKLGETPLRWNWQTPIELSKHQQDVFYMASNKVHRSLDQGDSFETMSGDLTRGGLEGNVPFGTLTTMAEHPSRFGQLAVGSDDGLVHVTMDGGYTWNRIPLPLRTQIGKGTQAKHLWVSEVSWSNHDKDLLVVALNGYRHDCLDAFVFATRDGGKTWENWGRHLPHEPVNALVESADREGWWVVGTDGGAYLTTDGGNSFATLHKDLPRVPVHDLIIQERENDLVLGTHGRGIFILDLSPAMPSERVASDWKSEALAFDRQTLEVTRNPSWNERGWAWAEPEEPTIDAWVWSSEDENAKLELRFIPAAPETPDSVATTGGGASAILDQLQESSGFVVDGGTVELSKGIQKVSIPLLRGDEFLDEGTYTVILVTQPGDGEEPKEATMSLVVLPEDQP